jgi:phospholipid/cholesterol/gamma-HCH transport system permease protein
MFLPLRDEGFGDPVGEEIDALETLGLDPARFLITPKVLALVVATPLLTALGDAIGIFGGMITAKAVLGIPLAPYWNETIEALGPSDVLGGLAKSVVFALLIAAVGCYRGLQVRHDPRSVGRQTTSAVVTGIFFIILTDAVFSIVYNILGI